MRAATRPHWTPADIPDLTGSRALVTGVTSGIGLQTALELARKGAEVLMAGRDGGRLARAMDRIRDEVRSALVRPLLLDLADLASVRRAAEGVLGPLDILVNNAGVMATPHRRTADGFELQLGTNHFGHFALTGLLWPQLTSASAARVVTVASQAHRLARSVPSGDPRQPPGRYRRWNAYAVSKLANLQFAFELDRRARASGASVTSVAAHPGLAATELFSNGPNRGGPRPDGAILTAATRLLAQSAAEAARPVLMAATLPGLPGGVYIGPGGPGEVRGPPRIVTSASADARDEAAAARLWELSERATGVAFP